MARCAYEDEIGRVRGLTRDVSNLATSTSLELLQAVDITIDGLAALQRAAYDLAVIAHSSCEKISRCKPTESLDAGSVMSDLLEQAEGSLAVEISVLKQKRHAARIAPELQGDHEEAVVSEYDRAIEACSDLHEAILDLRWAIFEHDAELSPVTASFTDPESLSEYLDKL